MTITTADVSGTVGLPGHWTEDIVGYEGLLTGHEPAYLETQDVLEANQTLAQYAVLGFNAAGRLVPAVRGSVDPANDIKPARILLTPITVASGVTNKVAPMLVAGCVNPNVLVWPASFSTAEHKRTAFYGAPTPTNIIVREPRTKSV